MTNWEIQFYRDRSSIGDDPKHGILPFDREPKVDGVFTYDYRYWKIFSVERRRDDSDSEVRLIVRAEWQEEKP